jgi:hypothetical protein
MDGRRLELRLAHSIYADVLREQAPPVRSQEMLRKLAEIVESKGARRREGVLRVATWRLAGGDADPERTLAAAVIARWRYDFPLAERLARRAVQAGAGFDARLLAAQSAALNGHVDDADRELAALAAEAANDDQLGRATMARLDNHVFHPGGLDKGLRMTADAQAVIEDPVWRDELSARRSGVVAGTHGPRAAAEIAGPILDRGSGRAVARAAITATPALAKLGRIDAALRSSAIGCDAHMRLAEPLDWYPWTHLATALALSGEAQAASDALAALDALALPPTRFFAVNIAQARAWAQVAGGNLPAACRLLQDAAELGAEIGDYTGEAPALHGLARLGQAGSVADQLAAVAERIEGVLAPARAARAGPGCWRRCFSGCSIGRLRGHGCPPGRRRSCGGCRRRVDSPG